MRRLAALQVVRGALVLAMIDVAPAVAFAQEAGEAGIPAASTEPVAVTERFAFYDDVRINLHHFLLNWASEEAGLRPPYAPAFREHGKGLEQLTADERERWSAAVDAYAQVVDRNFVFDDGLVAVRDAAGRIGPRSAVPPEDQALLDALDDALDVYRTHWWPEHSEINRAWTTSVVQVLEEVETGIARRLAVVYGGAWPDERVRVDVATYANAVGAYSTDGVVTFAAGDPDNAMPQAVEMVFHESSHIDPLEQPLRDAVSAAFEAESLEAPDRLWHDLIFYTSGEATRLEFARQGLGDYRHYGSLGVYNRGERWPGQLEAFAVSWRPFIEEALPSGNADGPTVEERHRALRQVARTLEADQ